MQNNLLSFFFLQPFIFKKILLFKFIADFFSAEACLEDYFILLGQNGFDDDSILRWLWDVVTKRSINNKSEDYSTGFLKDIGLQFEVWKI